MSRSGQPPPAPFGLSRDRPRAERETARTRPPRSAGLGERLQGRVRPGRTGSKRSFVTRPRRIRPRSAARTVRRLEPRQPCQIGRETRAVPLEQLEHLQLMQR